MSELNIGSLIADQYKDTEAASNPEEALTGNKSELDYSQDEATKETTNETEVEKTQYIVEEPKGETTEDNSSLHNEESTDTKSDTNETVYSFEDELAKRTDGKYSSVDDMLNALEQTQNQKEFEYANDLIAKLDKLAKEGVNVDLDFVQAQMVDYSKYDLEDVNQAIKLIEMELKLNEPDITKRELEFEISERYKLDEDLYDESDIERSKLRLLRDAKKAVKALQDNQQSMSLPKGGIDPEKQRLQEEQFRKAQEELSKTLKSAVNTYEKESMSIGDEKFDYVLNNETKKNLENVMMNTDKFFNRYIKKDGSVDTDKLRSDMLWIVDRENMIKSYLGQATSKGAKDVVKDIKNTSFDGKSGARQSSDFSIAGAIANHFKNRN